MSRKGQRVKEVPAATEKGVRLPWLTVVALGMAMLVFGIAESYGPVIAVSSILPSRYSFLGFSLPYIAGGIGCLVAGLIADRLGRRNSFLLVAAMIVVGVVVFLAAPANVFAIAASFVLIGMAAIGLETPILTVISEAVPARWRGNIEVIVQNFGNLGVAMTFIPLFIGLSAAQSELAYAIMLIAPLIAMVIGYFGVQESLPWQAVSKGASNDVENAWKSVEIGETEKVIPTSGVAFRFLIILLIGIVQDVAFVWITYNVAYFYFANSVASLVPIIGGLTMAVVGVIFGALIANRVSRKSAASVAFGLLVALWAILWIYVEITRATSGIPLLAIMTALFVPTELTWGVRAMLTPELFPTRTRGTMVSIVRMLVWVTTGVTVMAMSYRVLPLNYSFGAVFGIFAIGLIAALAWQLYGYETGGKSLAGYDVSA